MGRAQGSRPWPLNFPASKARQRFNLRLMSSVNLVVPFFSFGMASASRVTSWFEIQQTVSCVTRKPLLAPPLDFSIPHKDP